MAPRYYSFNTETTILWPGWEGGQEWLPATTVLIRKRRFCGQDRGEPRTGSPPLQFYCGHDDFVAGMGRRPGMAPRYYSFSTETTILWPGYGGAQDWLPAITVLITKRRFCGRDAPQ